MGDILIKLWEGWVAAFQPFNGVNDLRNVVLLDQWVQFNEIFIQSISFMIKSIKYIEGSPRDHSSTLYSICDHNCSRGENQEPILVKPI